MKSSLLHPKDDVEAAAAAWFRQQPKGPADFDELIVKAFRAGMDYARQQGLAAAAKPVELEGTPESRTLIAALTFFKEQVLLQQPEEVLSGEWLGPTDVDALIATIRTRTK